MPRRAALPAAGVVLVMTLVAGGVGGPGAGAAASGAEVSVGAVTGALALTGSGGPTTGARWAWPVEGAAVSRPYAAPATRYASGHRGVDLAAGVGAAVLAPTDGTVLFVGRVVDRGVLTLDVGGGVVVTFEPIETALTPGETVARGEALATVGVGGHAAAGDLHLGVRVAGEYVDPMRFYRGTPRAVLLPCC